MKLKLRSKHIEYYRPISSHVQYNDNAHETVVFVALNNAYNIMLLSYGTTIDDFWNY